MKIVIHTVNDKRIAEVDSEGIIIQSVEDAADLLGNLYYSDFDRIIIHQKNINSEFFDLKSGIAGEILQKFANFRVRLIIVGDFTSYNSKSLNQFIFESNNNKQVNFLNSLSDALNQLSL